MVLLWQLEKAAPVLAGLKQPIVVAKIDADKYRSLANKHEIEYVQKSFLVVCNCFNIDFQCFMMYVLHGNYNDFEWEVKP